MLNEYLRRAYAATAEGRYDDALEHLRDAADIARFDGQHDEAAAATRAYVKVSHILGRRHMVRA